MKTVELVIPEPPQPFVLGEKAKENLKKWINFFNNLSSRIWCRDSFSEEILVMLESKAKSISNIDNGKIIDWPKQKDIAFFIYLNSSPKNDAESLLNTEEIFVFCFNDRAFGLDYFEWDGDEYNQNCNTFSLSNYSEKALSWNYISEVIKNRLMQIEESVPKI